MYCMATECSSRSRVAACKWLARLSRGYTWYLRRDSRNIGILGNRRRRSLMSVKNHRDKNSEHTHPPAIAILRLVDPPTHVLDRFAMPWRMGRTRAPITGAVFRYHETARRQRPSGSTGRGAVPRRLEMSCANRWKPECCKFPLQPRRSAPWMLLKPNGRSTSSARTGTSFFCSRAYCASSCTHMELTDRLDQMVTAQRALSSCPLMASLKRSPGARRLSHHTDHPCVSGAFASFSANFRSSRA